MMTRAIVVSLAARQLSSTTQVNVQLFALQYGLQFKRSSRALQVWLRLPLNPSRRRLFLFGSPWFIQLEESISSSFISSWLFSPTLQLIFG